MQFPGSRAQASSWYMPLDAPQRVDLPRPGIRPGSPALAGRLSTTEPPGNLLKLWERTDFICGKMRKEVDENAGL